MNLSDLGNGLLRSELAGGDSSLGEENRDHPDKAPSKQANRNRAFRSKQIGPNFANPLPFRDKPSVTSVPRTVRS